MKNSLVHKNVNRVWEIDFIRGFAVALLIFDHLMFLVWGVFGPEWAKVNFNGHEFFREWYIFATNYWNGTLRGFFGPFFASVFIFISGLSTTFSKNNFKRGYLLLLFSFALTITSYYVMPDSFIHFGVLSLLSFSMLTWEFLNRLFDGNKKLIIVTELALSMSLFIAEYIISINHIPAPNKFSVFLTREWANQINPEFSPGDFFPLYFNLAIFLLGATFGNIFYSKKESHLKRLNLMIFKPINFLGRHSLVFYIFPQLTFMILLALISKFMITGSFVII